MSRKFLVPLFIALFIAAAGCIAMAAVRHTQARSSHKMECTCEQSQNDMMIWESLGRTIVTVASY